MKARIGITSAPAGSTAPSARALVAVKLVHTAIWVFFVACIIAMPVAGWYKHFGFALLLCGFVLFECAVLAMNRGKCPLTTIASRFTADRSPAFDIYLPQWLARWNKVVFGAMFVVNCLVVLGQWIAGTGRLPLK
jgi:hypothetical protein